jgi:hypothetical protein
MRLSKSFLLAALGSLAFAPGAFASMMSGSFGVVDFYGGGAYSAGSFQLAPTNLITASLAGTFATDVPPLSDLTANTLTISGITATPSNVTIYNYLEFSSGDATFGTSGTTPPDRFDFKLQTLAQTAPNAFAGTGTLADLAGVYDPTPASFTVSFSAPNNYSLTFAATPVPEPATLGLTAVAIASLAVRRRRSPVA